MPYRKTALCTLRNMVSHLKFTVENYILYNVLIAVYKLYSQGSELFELKSTQICLHVKTHSLDYFYRTIYQDNFTSDICTWIYVFQHVSIYFVKNQAYQIYNVNHAYGEEDEEKKKKFVDRDGASGRH